MEETKVRLMHCDPRWRQEFQQTRSSILHSCAGWVTAVEHVGSTAIPGLISRPIIDVLAGVADESGLGKASNLIEGLNFRINDSPEWSSDAFSRSRDIFQLLNPIRLIVSGWWYTNQTVGGK